MGEPATKLLGGGPRLDRSYGLHLVGDWGQANLHRMLCWITQEFCDRAGPRSRTAMWSWRGGGMEGFDMVNDGEAHLAVATPANLMKSAITGEGIFGGRKYPHLRALATLPQNDRVVLALDPSLGCKTFADIRAKKPKMKIVLPPDDRDSATGYVCHRFLEAHGISAADILAWGGEILSHSGRADQCLIPAQDPKSGITAVIQEAIMTPWWTLLIDDRNFVPIPAEKHVLEELEKTLPGLGPASLPAGYWNSLKEELPALGFSDFVMFVRDDLPDDVVYLLTWILDKTKWVINSQYQHIPQHKSPLGYPFEPEKMVITPLPLHPAAERYWREEGYLK
ncbi:hypothetical protein BHE90_016262 [Fusarium euwallaceae]|uniref:Uncharacterized protein n=1 Tax=Fusarium euwallaceae TaxID=1147111 RepID=A0A430L0X5_9HYPO|nr:hypothetical protein BHE90_016262 [Fusarium euwallaceae]